MTAKTATEIWAVVHAERRRLVDDLTGLDAGSWVTASLCPGWDVHDVLAHLVDTARTTRLRFVRDLVMARFDFDRANEAGIARERHRDPAQTLAALREVADLTRTPPADLTTRLVEAIVHGEDIRRPLGMAGDYPVSAIADALGYQLRTRASMGGGRERAAGLLLVATDIGRSWGTGAEVTGSALDLLLAVSGRPVPGDALVGEGAGRLQPKDGT